MGSEDGKRQGNFSISLRGRVAISYNDPPTPQLTVTTSNTGQTGIDLRLREVGQLFKSGAVSKSDRVKQLVISHSGGVKLGGRPVIVRCRRFWPKTTTDGDSRAP